MEFDTDRKHEKLEKTKKLVFQKENVEVAQRCSAKMVFFEMVFMVSFLINFVKKEALAQLFACEFWKISENTFFYRSPPVAASGFIQLPPSPIYGPLPPN